MHRFPREMSKLTFALLNFETQELKTCYWSVIKQLFESKPKWLSPKQWRTFDSRKMFLRLGFSQVSNPPRLMSDSCFLWEKFAFYKKTESPHISDLSVSESQTDSTQESDFLNVFLQLSTSLFDFLSRWWRISWFYFYIQFLAKLTNITTQLFLTWV